VIAADRDDNGTGQLKAEEAAKVCKGKAALPPETGDWNDVWQAQGDIATQALLTSFTQPHKPSPFESVSEADLKAMSASEKAELLVDHYGQALAVPPVGEEICR
jgi:putative DNA primase/helicase